MDFTAATCLFRKSVLVAFLCLALTENALSQATLDRAALDKLDRDVTFLLLDKDISAVANELAAQPETTAVPLLRRLIIYARAGQSARVQQTLERLADAPDWQCQRPHEVGYRIRRIIGEEDLLAWRTYYDRLCPRDTGGVELFVRLWENKGDPKDLDRWLAARSEGFDEWYKLRIYRRAKLGTANELLDPLAVAVRTNPRDLKVAEQYLLANNWAGDLQDVSWLADVCAMATAYENLELGQLLEHRSPRAAAGVFEKSLALPFTEQDATLILARGLRTASLVRVKVNWEKQLRFWTKLGLARTYQAVGRSQDAQRLVEELLAVKGDDIVRQDVHQLAGQVQADSGQRAVEGGVLRNEASQGNTSQYWLERARYYRGRNEYELEKDTYRKAIDALASRSVDDKATAERLEVVRAFSFFLYDKRDQRENWRADLEALLRREFKHLPSETSYCFAIAQLITQNEFDLDELRDSLFVEQPETLASLLAPRADWGSEEELLIGRALSGDEISAGRKEKAWAALEKLVSDFGSSCAYRLAEAMIYAGAVQRATPFLLGYLKKAPLDDEQRGELIRKLIRVYCDQDNWRNAETLLFANKKPSWRFLPSALGEIAVSAARSGATDEAVRLWRLKMRLDRHDLESLARLANTKARPQLQAIYSQMKKDDPLSSTPDLALRLLQ